jgi:hypothetical protein
MPNKNFNKKKTLTSPIKHGVEMEMAASLTNLAVELKINFAIVTTCHVTSNLQKE